MGRIAPAMDPAQYWTACAHMSCYNWDAAEAINMTDASQDPSNSSQGSAGTVDSYVLEACCICQHTEISHACVCYYGSPTQRAVGCTVGKHKAWLWNWWFHAVFGSLFWVGTIR